MQTRRVGPSGLEVGRLGLAATGWGRELDAQTCADLLATFRDAGGTLIVAAPGTAEEIVGTLIGATHAREDVVLATSTPAGALGRKQVLDDLDAALDRLRTDRVDLWLLDGADPQTPIEETLQAVDLAVSSGRVRYAGVTGMAPWRVAAAATWQRALPGQRTPLVAAFGEFSLVAREAQEQLLPACEELGLGILAGAPLGYGVLTGKYRGGTPRDSRMAAPLWAEILTPYLPREGIVDAILTVADGLGVSPAAVALSWVRDHPGVVAPIVGGAHDRAAAGGSDQRTPDAAGADPQCAGRGQPRSPRRVSSLLQEFADAGLWPGLGRTAAAQLVSVGIVEPRDVTAAALTKLNKVGVIRAQRLFDSFIKSAEVLDVLELLLVPGIESRLAGPIARAVGPGSAAALQADPWRILEAAGTSPPLADRLARALAVQGPDLRLRRGAAIAAWCLRDAAVRGGHTAMTRADLTEACRRWQVELAECLEQADLMVDGGLISVRRFGEAEDTVAQDLSRLECTAKDWGTGGEITGLDDVQAGAVAHALQHGVSILTGGPGTGKSHTVAAIVRAAQLRGKSIALAAPTGRAAKRLEELAEHPASTLHRLLEAQRLGDDGEPGGFSRTRDNKLECDLLVIDEASMLDAELAAAVVDACTDGTHVVFVGDPAQLPSVGAGRVLGDLIEADRIPSTELSALYRHAEGGAIARLAAAVRTGELPSPPPPATCGYEVVVLPVQSSAHITERVVSLVIGSIPDRLGIAASETQVVTPVHRGPAGTRALNAALKAVLNPGPGARSGFDVGDRVVATANRLDADGGGYANGEIGVVTDLPAKGGVTIAFPGGPVTVTGKDLGELVHGWCLTVHRAQGSEWPAVVLALPQESGRLLSRPLVYTGMTRAQRHLSVVSAVGPSLHRAVSEIDAIPRVTRLTHLVREKLPPS